MPFKSGLEIARLSDGTKIRYAVAEPTLLNSEVPPTVVIVMPLGLETYRNASLTISEIWQPVAESRGWVIVSPAEPDERFFWQDTWLYGEGAEIHFPGFLEHLANTYAVDNSDFHIVEVGHDGDGAVACVLSAPEEFASVTLIPYFSSDENRFRQLAEMPNIHTSVLLSDQAGYWDRDGSLLPFDVPGVIVKRIPVPDLLADEGIGGIVDALPFVCREIETAMMPRVDG